MSLVHRHGDRGTTLLEVLATASLSAIVLAIAVPNLAALGAPVALRTASQQIAADVVATRLRAIARDSRYRITFTAAAASSVIERESAPGVFVAEGATQALPHGAILGPVAVNPIFDTRSMLAAPITVAVTVLAAGVRTVSVNVLGQTTIG